jgi:uncharacterized membrane protein YbhN (UPF0104 family)
MKISNKIKVALKVIAIVVLFSFLSYLLYKNYNSIRKYQFSINIPYLILSFILLFIATLSLPVIWYYITKSFRCNLSLKESVSTRLISEMGKYLPGRILGYGYLLIHYTDAGFDKKRVLNCSYYELLLSTTSGFIYFTIIMLFCNYEKLNEFKFIFILISLIFIIAMHPYLLQRISNIIYGLFKIDKLDYKIPYSKVIKFLFLYLLVWLIYGFAFFFFTKAFSPVQINKIVYISGAYAVSTFAGFLAFFIPAGLGAREGMLIFLLTGTLGLVPAIIVSIGSRIWMIIGDVLFFIIALLLSKKKISC